MCTHQTTINECPGRKDTGGQSSGDGRKAGRYLFVLVRYWTKEVQGMLEKLVDAESRRDAALKDTMRSLFSSFDQQ